MTTEQAIIVIDEHFVWMANRKMINQQMLNKLSSALACIVENLTKLENEKDNENIRAAELILKLKTIILSCGLTEKFISDVVSFDFRFLNKWNEFMAKSERITNQPVIVEQLFIYERQTRLLAQTDVRTVKQYAFFIEKNLPEFVAYEKENYPHLKKWFDLADRGELKLNERKIFDELYQYHIDSWN